MLDLGKLKALTSAVVTIRGQEITVRPLPASVQLALVRQWPEPIPPGRSIAERTAAMSNPLFAVERQIRNASLMVAEAAIAADLGVEGEAWSEDWNQQQLKEWIRKVAGQITDSEVHDILRAIRTAEMPPSGEVIGTEEVPGN